MTGQTCDTVQRHMTSKWGGRTEMDSLPVTVCLVTQLARGTVGERREHSGTLLSNPELSPQSAPIPRPTDKPY